MYLSIKCRNSLQSWCKLNTRGIVKTLSVSFSAWLLHGDSLDVMFPQFLNHFLPFSMVFLHVSPSVSAIFSGASTVSPQCFPGFLFLILRFPYSLRSNEYV